MAGSESTVLLAGAGGALFSMQFLRRIDAITRTCNAIVAGRFNDRIALTGNDDELDRLARAINLMLDRIGTLLENLQQVSSDIAHDLRTHSRICASAWSRRTRSPSPSMTTQRQWHGPSRIPTSCCRFSARCCGSRRSKRERDSRRSAMCR